MNTLAHMEEMNRELQMLRKQLKSLASEHCRILLESMSLKKQLAKLVLFKSEVEEASRRGHSAMIQQAMKCADSAYWEFN